MEIRMRSLSLLLVLALGVGATPALGRAADDTPFTRPTIQLATWGSIARSEGPQTPDEGADVEARIDALLAERAAISDTGAKTAQVVGGLLAFGGVTSLGLGAIAYAISTSWLGGDGLRSAGHAMMGAGGGALVVGGVSLYSGGRRLSENEERRQTIDMEIRELRKGAPPAAGIGIGPGPRGRPGLTFHVIY